MLSGAFAVGLELVVDGEGPYDSSAMWAALA